MKKIVALWCHPRSMSTSVERLMRERGDFQCLHEPFMYHHYLNQKHRSMPFFEPQADHPVRYEDIRNMIMQKAQKAPVFFKDMGYYIDSELIADADFCESVTHCFLIRSPKAAIASYYKLDKEMTLREIGIEAQWTLYSHLVDSGIKPTVVQAENIRKDPHSAVEKWWKSIGLTNKETAFEWSEQTPEDWKQVETWHQSAISSTGIRPWSEEEAAKEVHQFEALALQAPHLRSYLEHHEIFYQRLKNASIDSEET